MITIKTSRNALLIPLQKVAGIVERRHTLPILSNVLIEGQTGTASLTATDLEVQTRLFRDGEKFYDGRLLDLKLGQIGPAARHYTGGQLSLGSKLAPGEYVMQVLVTDKLSKDKDPVAMQAIDFEVK